MNLFTAVWQWEGDDGQWELYPPAVCAQLDAAVMSGQTCVTLSHVPGGHYEADVVKMVQTNLVTKYKRKIRSQAVKPGQRVAKASWSDGRLCQCIAYVLVLHDLTKC